MKKIILLISVLVILTFALEVFALEVGWPKSPGIPGVNLTDDSNLADLIRYFYEWGIAFGGLAVFIALVIAGFQYLTSMGNPALMKEAKDRITSALLGLVLLLGSWLILNTINPQLTNLYIPSYDLKIDLAKIETSIREEYDNVSKEVKEASEVGPCDSVKVTYTYDEGSISGERDIEAGSYVGGYVASGKTSVPTLTIPTDAKISSKAYIKGVDKPCGKENKDCPNCMGILNFYKQPKCDQMITAKSVSFENWSPAATVHSIELYVPEAPEGSFF